MTLLELLRLKPEEYEGGKSYLPKLSFKKRADKALFDKAKPLPGGSGYTWSDTKDGIKRTILIFDPSMPQELRDSKDEIPVIGKLILYYSMGFYSVSTITVSPEYRSKRIGLALYGIVLDILKLPLLAGGTQTPAGRKMWKTLLSIPGVKVYALVYRDVDLFMPRDLTPAGKTLLDKIKKASRGATGQEIHNKFIREIGGKPFEEEPDRFFAIPVRAKGDEVENEYIDLYRSSFINLVATKK